MMTMNIKQFAFNLGGMTGKVREATLPFHKAYTTATPEQRTQLRSDWLTGHISGALKLSDKAVERILSQSRTERSSEHQAAYARASSDFSYHVIRGHKDKAEPARKQRIDKATREAATQFLAQFEGDTLAKQINAAIAVLRAMR